MAEQPEWKPFDTAPTDGSEFLAFWPAYKLNDEGDLTDEPTGEFFIGTCTMGVGGLDEPDALNAVGSRFDDDYEYGEPTHWMPLPAPPADAPKPR